MAPTDLYNRLKNYYTGAKEPDVPVLSTTTAVSLLILYTFIYVLPFYISSTTRPSPSLSRDAPSVIRARIRSVTITCLVCTLTTFYILSTFKHESPLTVLHELGYLPIGLPEVVKCLSLTAVLFAGPLFEDGVAGGWRDWMRLRGLHETISSWIGWRNYIAGPVTEEVLFRSASVPLLILAHVSNTKIIFLTPLIFGLAHVHHFYEFRITHPHTPLLAAVLRSLLQFSYTTLFGGYVTFLYMRTGSLLAVILVHTFCNWRGLPRLWGRMMLSENDFLSREGLGDNKREDSRADDSAADEKKHMGVMLDIAYYVILVGGAVVWYQKLWRFTESENTLVKF